MLVRRLWLTGFRNYDSLTVELGPGLTAVLGDNGQGKTNLVEAMAFLARLDSFRGTPTDALVRHGDEAAVVRAEVVHADGRELLVEAEIGAGGRTRVLVNRQRLVRSRDLLGVLRVTVFSPDDLALVKGAPGERRRFLDDVLVALQPAHDRLRREVERVLKQRTTLLKQAGGRLSPEVELTLDVWDARLVESGEALGRLRADLVADLEPLVAKAYEQLAGGAGRHPAGVRPGLAAHRPGRRPRGGARHRPPAGGDVGRPASRRRRHLARGAAGAHPRVAGRAAGPGAGAAPRAPTRSWPSASTSRPCSCSTTCSPSSIPTGPPPSSGTSPRARWC